MAHGGKREGAGRKHRTGPTSRYRIVKKDWEWRHAIGRRVITIGKQCEVMQSVGHSGRKQIIRLMSALHGVPYSEVKRCWDDYRALVADLTRKS